MKTDLFPSCGHSWVFQICWHIECSTFMASSFRVWNRSTGIPSPPLAFFVVMLPKACLTSHSRMSGSRWVTTPSWLSGSWRSFLYSYSMDSCHLFLISSASVRSVHFCPYCAHLCMKCSLGSSNLLEEISSLSHSIAFEMWCWRRLLRVPWTARRSNQSILKEISPEYSLEGLMLKLKLQYFGHLMQRTNSLERTLMLGKIRDLFNKTGDIKGTFHVKWAWKRIEMVRH